ncbi:MAG: sodium:solute symporter family transporter [Candidatus Amoebophilus sp.]
MFLFVIWIGILLLANNPNLSPNNLLNFIIDNYSYTWLKGLIGIGIISMAMSTADSDLNSSAVLFVNDIIKPLGIFNKNLMLITRVLALVLGAFALLLALRMQDLLSILLLFGSFYMPIVSVPLLLAIFGFRSTTRAVLIGMSAGFITVLWWEIFMGKTGINSLGLGMVANLVFLIGSHYILQEQGGWVGIQKKRALTCSKASPPRSLEKIYW